MNPDDPEDRSLREKMRDLRARDERSAPPFDAMWRAASEGAARRKTSPRWLAPSITMGGLAAAAAVAIFVMQTPDRAEPSASSAPVAASAAPHARAVAIEPFASRPELALDFLLASPSTSDLSSLTSFDADPLSRRAGGF